MGCRFAKWRAVISIAHKQPTQYCLDTNAHALARYARLCQEAGLVPIVEPEVLMDGEHSIDRCYDICARALDTVFSALFDQGVHLEGMLLKPNMILSGKACETQASVEEVAEKTLRCLYRNVPAAVAGIVFLSGGQSNELASARLNAMNATGKAHPWPVSFSYGRALQQPALVNWGGDDTKIPDAQAALLHRAKCNGAASLGKYDGATDAPAT